MSTISVMKDPNYYADLYNSYEKNPKKIKVLDSTLREGEHVITSYSIHYTKLYEQKSLTLFFHINIFVLSSLKINKDDPNFKIFRNFKTNVGLDYFS